MRTNLPAITALALAVLCALPEGVARADNTADEADLRFRRGVEAWRQRRYEDALAEFFTSNRLVRNRNVILNIARSCEQLERYEEAYRYYDEVLAENPTAEDRKFVEERLARLAPRVALLRVESDPPGATVFIDREDLGERGLTPRTLALPPGKAVVMLSKPGHRGAMRTVKVETGRTTEVKLPLEFIWGQVKLTGSPEGAEVRVDTSEGEPAGTVPGLLKLAPGRHLLNVSAPRHLPAQVLVEIKGDQEEAATVALQPLPDPTGSLVVSATYDGAMVRVDGREIGFTPAATTLTAGEHRVEVTMDEMHPFVQTVRIAADERTLVKAELRYAGAKTTAASKTETTVDEVPASITVITREEIDAFGYTTLAEALRAVRGIFLSYDRTYDYTGVRGFSPPGDYNTRLLILYDGHPMNELAVGQAYVGREHNVDLNEVERIEVVRGPVSSLFGTSAFFGVINVVPRHSLGEKHAEGEVATGSLDLARGRATASGDLGGLTGLLTVAGMRAYEDGLYFATEDDADVLARRRVDETAVNVSGRVSYKKLSLLASWNTRTKRNQWYTSGEAPVATEASRTPTDARGFVEARFDAVDASGTGLVARAYYDAARFDKLSTYDDASSFIARTDADWAGLELRWRSPEILRQRLSVGAEYQRQMRILQQTASIAAPGAAPMLELDDVRRFNVASAWLADELRLGELLLINASVRADYYFDSFGLTVNPRLAFISRAIPGGITKLMGGRSFRAPSAFERFFSDPIRDPVTGQLTGEYYSSRPSPDLKPETVLTAELEHTQELARGLRLTGAVYVNDLHDLIYEAEVEDELLAAVNATGTVRTQGAELELRWQPTRWTMFSGAYWYQRLRTFGLDRDQELWLKANIPPHAFSLRAALPIHAPLLIGSLEAVYNAPRPYSDDSGETEEIIYLAAGLSGGMSSYGLRYYAGVQNLLNERTTIPATLDGSWSTPNGRTVLVQVSASY